MKVLIVNTFDIQGGAARATYRLHRSLIDSGVDSHMLVQYKLGDDDAVITTNSFFQKIFNKVRPILDDAPVRLYPKRTKTLFSPSRVPSGDIVKKINDINPDIVHLHWVCAGMIRIEDIAKIKAPIVWSLHDMGAFTGGCHYNEGCGLYKSMCGSCKVLGSKKGNDLSRKMFNRKKEIFSQIDNLTIVGLSNWLSNCSKQSVLFQNKSNVNLPNPINTKQFQAIAKNEARDRFMLSKNKKFVLFGAMNATSDPRKGFAELCAALQKLKGEDVELVVFGNKNKIQRQILGFKTHYLGRINDDKDLVALYSATDVMIVPSLQENLSNAIMESLSCSTPVVGFDIGGNGDMVEHKKNGYLAKPFNTKDLACGIEWVLYNENYDELCNNARKKVVENFDTEIVAKKYIALYEEILGK